MHINGIEFLETGRGHLINTDKGEMVRVLGHDEFGWQVQVGMPTSGKAAGGEMEVTCYATFDEACQAASEVVAALPEVPEFMDFINGKWYESGSAEAEEAERAEEEAAAIREYVTQRSQYQPRISSGTVYLRGNLTKVEQYLDQQEAVRLELEKRQK